MLTRFAGTVRDTAAQVASAARRRRSGGAGVEAVESGPVPDEAVNLPVGGGPVAWVVGHPMSTLAAVLTLAAAIATREFWGDGWLQGGALLPAPSGSGPWWETYSSILAPRRHGLAGDTVAVRGRDGAALDGAAREVVARRSARGRAGGAAVGDRCVCRGPPAGREPGRPRLDEPHLCLAAGGHRDRHHGPHRHAPWSSSCSHGWSARRSRWARPRPRTPGAPLSRRGWCSRSWSRSRRSAGRSRWSPAWLPWPGRSSAAPVARRCCSGRSWPSCCLSCCWSRGRDGCSCHRGCS